MKTKHILGGLTLALALTAMTRPAAADFFDNGGPLCSLLSIGCPPPPPPPPPPVVAEPEPVKPVRHARKRKVVKKAAPKAEAAAPAAPAAPPPAPTPQ